MPTYPSNMPFSVETIFESMLVFTFVQIISSHNSIQKFTATIRLDTSPVAFPPGFSTNSKIQFSSVHNFPEPAARPLPPATQI